MLVVLRILFGFALFAVLGKAIEVAGPTPQTDGIVDAGYLAVTVLIGIANAVVWAPWVGRWMADPLTGAFTAGHPADFSNATLQLAHKLALRRRRRLALFFAFLEGVRHPDLPGAFVLGLGQAKPGSWLEKVFAKEVWRFDNAENCLRAWKILKERGIERDLHRRPEVNLLLLSQRREVPAPAAVLPVPAAPRIPKPARNSGIRLFQGSESAKPGESGPEMPAKGNSEKGSPLGEEGVELREATGPKEESAGSGIETFVPRDAAASLMPPAGVQPGKLGVKERLRVLFTGRMKS